MIETFIMSKFDDPDEAPDLRLCNNTRTDIYTPETTMCKVDQIKLVSIKGNRSMEKVTSVGG